MKLGEQLLDVALIDDHESIQARAEFSNDLSRNYAEDMEAGDVFPAIDVFFDGTTYRIADGRHRYSAVVERNGTQILANVAEGGRFEAILHAVRANRKHGARFSNRDKAHAVALLLAEPDVAEWSDRKVAKACGVTHPFVASIRRPEPKETGNAFHAEAVASPIVSTVKNSTVTGPSTLETASSVAIPPTPDSSVGTRSNLDDADLQLAADVEKAFSHARALADAALVRPRARGFVENVIIDLDAWIRRNRRMGSIA